MSRNLVENEAYAAFCSRIVKSFGERVGDGDVEHLALLRQLRTWTDEAEGRAVLGLMAQGYSYAEIGAGMGLSRQRVHQLSVQWRHTQAIGN